MAQAKRKAKKRTKTRLSQPATYLSRPRKKRAKKRKKSHKVRLSELWNPTTAANTAKQLGGAALGGGLWNFAEKMVPMDSPGKKLIYGGVAGFVAGALFKMPNLGCGIVGAATYSAVKDSGFLAQGEESENSYVKNMEQMPLMLMNDQAIDPQAGLAMLSEAMPNNQYYVPNYAFAYNY